MSGMAELNAGVRNAWPTPHAHTKTKMSSSDTCPSAMHVPMIRATAAMNRSHTMMMRLRLKRSAITPPKGDSSPTGRKAHTYTKASASGLPVDSVTYQTAA